MTAEVVLMNKQAVAMAADSAGTIGMKTLNSNNKLFMLSKRHPVGIMIYGSAEIMGYPWETIIKMYRKLLGQKRFLTLKDQVEHFKCHLEKLDLFNARSKELYIENAFQIVINRILGDIRKLKILFQNQENIEKEFIIRVISLRKEMSETEMMECNIPEDKRNEILANYDKFFNEKILENFISYGINEDIKNDILSIVRNAIFKNPEEYLGYSGVVLSGFGDNEVFPSAVGFKVSSVIDENIIMSKQEIHSINLDKNAHILSFAQKDMIESFVYGIDPNFKSEIEEGIQASLCEIQEVVIETMGISQEQKDILNNSLDETFNAIGNALFKRFDDYTAKSNVSPILSGVSMLPPEDLAMMAETLVNLTSFKRKISANQMETVGGPTDVAVITKGDGFVWIKKKHYFQADRNYHFFSNYFYGETENEAK
jgi:uncharacterized protein (UPF0305 family)